MKKMLAHFFKWAKKMTIILVAITATVAAVAVIALIIGEALCLLAPAPSARAILTLWLMNNCAFVASIVGIIFSFLGKFPNWVKNVFLTTYVVATVMNYAIVYWGHYTR